MFSLSFVGGSKSAGGGRQIRQRIWTGESIYASVFGPGGPYPPTDLDRWGPNPPGHRDDVSSQLKYFQLSSEILDYKLILFRSGHFDHDIMEKKITVIGMF